MNSSITISSMMTALILSLIAGPSLTIGIAEGGGYARDLESAQGYHALLVSPAGKKTEQMRNVLDQRCGYRAQLAEEDLLQVRSWIQQVKENAVVVLFYFSGSIQMIQNEIHLGSIPLSKLIEELLSTSAAETLIIVDSPGNLPSGMTPNAFVKLVESKAVTKGASGHLHCLLNLTNSSSGVPFQERFIKELMQGANLNSGAELTWTRFQQIQSFTDTDVVCSSTSQTQSTHSLVRRRPLKVQELIEDLADAIASELHTHKIPVVAVPDFVLKEGFSLEKKVPGQNYGELLRKSAMQLRRELELRSNFQYQVLGDDSLREVLAQAKISPSQINGRALFDVYQQMQKQKFSFAVDGKSLVMVPVELWHCAENPAELLLSATAWSTPAGTPLLSERRGVALLNTSEWGETGYSSINHTAMVNFTSSPAPPTTPVSLVESTEKTSTRKPQPLDTLDFFDEENLRWNQASINGFAKEQQHPLLDPKFPFRVSLISQGKYKKSSYSDDRKHCYVRMQSGETYSIEVLNNSPHPVFMRLLVDGLNTVPDRPLLKKEGIFEIAEKDSRAPFAEAQIVRLTNARAWFCEPGRYHINGFLTAIKNERTAEVAAFVVTDAADSAAWERSYRKDLGIITAAFYAPLEKPKDLAPNPTLATKLGKRTDTPVEVYRGKSIPGELLGVVHLRYGFTE